MSDNQILFDLIELGLESNPDVLFDPKRLEAYQDARDKYHLLGSDVIEAKKRIKELEKEETKVLKDLINLRYEMIGAIEFPFKEGEIIPVESTKHFKRFGHNHYEKVLSNILFYSNVKILKINPKNIVIEFSVKNKEPGPATIKIQKTLSIEKVRILQYEVMKSFTEKS